MKTLLSVIVLLLALLACKGSAPTDHRAPAVSAEPAVAPAPAEDTPIEAIGKLTTLQEAVSFAKPFCSDVVNEVSPGEILLAVWMKDRLAGKDLDAIPATTVRAVLKDSEEARGKRLCGTGKVVQIARSRIEQWGASKVWQGLVMLPSRDVLHFTAVGETGEIVEDTTATLCGVVVGRYTYSNAGGGTTHAVAVTGHFRSYVP